MRSVALAVFAVTSCPALVAAAGLSSPTVIHRTAPGPAVLTPAQPAAPSGVTSITPSVVLGWGGLAPSTGQPAAVAPPVYPGGYPGYPVATPYPTHPGYPPYPTYPGYAPYPGYPVPPGVIVSPAAPDSLHRWGTR